jgi:DNA replication protein DnaC
LASGLSEKHRDGNLSKALQELQKLGLLILDELDYIQFRKTASQLLCHEISNNYQQQCVIITSNLEFGGWNEIFRDDRLTAALIEHLVYQAHIVGFSSSSLCYLEMA